MKINAVINTNFFKNSEYKNYITVSVVFLILTSGLIFGSIIYILTEEFISSDILEKFIVFSTDFSSKSKPEIFSGLLISHIPYVIMTVIFGTSALGYPLIGLLGFIKCSGLGLISSYLYSAYGLKGMEYGLLVFYPGKVVLLFSILFLMNITIRNSMKIKEYLNGERGGGYKLTDYYLKVIVITVFFILSALIDFIAVILFSQLFTFS